MKKISFARRLALMKACPEAIKWVGKRTIETAWKECKRGDWMFWLLQRTEIADGSAEHKSLILATCEIARLALPEWEKFAPDDKRPHEAIAAAERFAVEWSQEAESAAMSAAWSAESAASSAAYAAWSAESAASSAVLSAESAARSAAWSAAWTAESAAWTAESAARSAVLSAESDEFAAWSAEWSAARSAQADIIRKHFQVYPKLQEVYDDED